MINLATETVVSLTEATAYLPRRRGGKKPSVSTLYRWAKHDLEILRVGGTTCTSVEALQRFCERRTLLSRTKGLAAPDATASTSDTHEAISKRLDGLGI